MERSSPNSILMSRPRITGAPGGTVCHSYVGVIGTPTCTKLLPACLGPMAFSILRRSVQEWPGLRPAGVSQTAGKTATGQVAHATPEAPDLIKSQQEQLIRRAKKSGVMAVLTGAVVCYVAYRKGQETKPA